MLTIPLRRPFRVACLRMAVAALLLLATTTSSAYASLIGGTLRVRVSDEYYAYYVGEGGGWFTPFGLATVDPTDSQAFLMPITDESQEPDYFTFWADGSGITLHLPETTSLPFTSGTLADFMVQSYAGGTPVFVPLATATGHSLRSAFYQLVVEFSRMVPYTMGPGGPDGLVTESMMQNALNAWLDAGVPIVYNTTDGYEAIFSRAQADVRWSYFEFSVIPPTPVPEPGAVTLLPFALVALGVLKGRWR